MNKKMVVEIYTDGSATTSDKPGGWAFRVVGNGTAIYENSGHMEKASNNDAELEAALQGLEYIKTKYDINKRDPKEDDILLISDSQLVLGWASERYRGKQPEKIDRINRLKELIKALSAKTKWVKGHSGNVHNTRCDKLAKNARKGAALGSTSLNPKDTKIGTRKKGTLSLLYKGTGFVVDLEGKAIEEYDKDVHGYREFFLQVTAYE